MKNFFKKFAPYLPIPVFGLALYVLHSQLKVYHYRQIADEIQNFTRGQLFFAFLLTLINYVVLTLYEVLALRYTRKPLAYRQIFFASFIGYAFSNNIGFSLFSGGSLRYRIYTMWGLSTMEIAQVVSFLFLTFWLGLLTVAGIAFLVEPIGLPWFIVLPFSDTRPLGVLFLCVVGGYLALVGMYRETVKFKNREFAIPSFKISSAQIAVAATDWLICAGVLYVLLPRTDFSYSAFLPFFLLAQIGGLLSHLPGGLGIFEGILIYLLSSSHPIPGLVGSLIFFRVVYYIIPLLVAGTLFAGHSLLRNRRHILSLVGFLNQWGPLIVPEIFSVLMFMSGTLLLLSVATPAVKIRLQGMQNALPLYLVEGSHFVAALAGLILLFLARGLQRRLDAAFFVSIVFLAVGALTCLLKGLDYEEASVLTLILVILIPCHRFFYRKTSLTSQPFSPTWFAAIMIILISSFWLGMFSYKHVEYSNSLWLKFGYFHDVPRFLRAMTGVFGATLILGVVGLLGPGRPKPHLCSDEDLRKAVPILKTSPSTSANLVFLKDKSLLFSGEGHAFIMYGVSRRSWVALGNPIGGEAEIKELLWDFLEMCDEYHGNPVFYEVSERFLPYYIDLGLSLIKIGEEARVELPEFNLEGFKRKRMRHTVRNVEKEAVEFEIVPVEQVPFLMPELKRISDDWLVHKNTSEKGFSLGFFKGDYVPLFPCAVVRKDRKIVAFSNLWFSGDKTEISVDLMRSGTNAPDGVIENLFVKIMLWGREQGFQWFNLGMAPLSGIQKHPLAPTWNKLGSFLFKYGEHFYNFQGLRAYKEKFHPVWEAQYLASPGGLALPGIFLDVATLISGGFKGILFK